MANFGTVKFGTDNTGVVSTCYATMVTSGGATKASPSNASSDGTSFSVTWVSSGP